MNTLKGSRQLAITLLAVLVVLLISLSWALADTSPSLEEWNRTFGGSQDDGGYSVQETSDGGYIIIGSTTPVGAFYVDVYLVKTDSQGHEPEPEQKGIPGFPYEALILGLFLVLLILYRFQT